MLLLSACADVLKADAPLLSALLILHLLLAGLWAWLPGTREVPGTATVLWLVASILATSYGWLLWKRQDLGVEAYALLVIAVAALNLVLDFDFIEQGVHFGAPKYMEWYGAFGIIVTLVWLYLEILRLLSKLRSRS